MPQSDFRSKGEREYRASTEYAVEEVDIGGGTCGPIVGIRCSSVFMGYGYDILVNGVTPSIL